MSNSLDVLKLISVCSAFKAYRRNSVLYRYEKMYQIAKALRMSVNTLSKMIKRAEDMGILIPCGKHKVFIGIPKMLEILFPEKKGKKHIQWYKEDKSLSWKEFYEKIKLSFAKINFSQQQYNINLIKDFRTGTNRKMKTIYTKLKKKYGVNSEKELNKCICRAPKEVVTGGYSISKLIGCSVSTGIKLLAKWQKNNSIERTINLQFIKLPITEASYIGLKAAGYKFVTPAKSRAGWWANLGSIISKW